MYDYSELSNLGSDKAGKVGKPEIMQGLLVRHIKKSGFHCKSNQGALKAFKSWNNMIRSIIFKNCNTCHMEKDLGIDVT